MGNPVLLTEGRVTLIDGLLAVAVLAGLLLNTLPGWWWADPLADVAALVVADCAIPVAEDPHQLGEIGRHRPLLAWEWSG